MYRQFDDSMHTRQRVRPPLTTRTFILLVTTMLLLSCGRGTIDTTPRVRHLKAGTPEDFHKPIRITVGWMPYEEDKLSSEDGSTYRIEQSEDQKTGKLPALIVTYEDGTTVTLDMAMDDELLGKLIKSSLMSERPIRRPYSEFMQIADCSTCHPSDILLR